MHRITGLILVAYALFHIKTLSLIADAAAYDARMDTLSGPIFVFLEWALALPVMLHAVNGGRLILFESFAFRNDGTLLKNVFLVSGLYALVLGILMLSGDQTMTPLAFWLPVLAVSLTLSWGLTSRMALSGLPATFIIQRVTGAFMLIIIPAHLLFMHLSPETAKSSTEVLARMRIGLIRIADTALVVAVLYHAGHGLISILGDYIGKGLMRALLRFAIIALMVFFGVTGLQLIWSV
jgi:succinate dehydrogenase hydrophobic membrane anchor protein